ncbi:MAG: hypothetical protein M3Y86_02005, partial [Verrucomicrobiota bacterium]|nr:hypothetical protein [Verrucomicrobiota bacterium]
MMQLERGHGAVSDKTTGVQLKFMSAGAAIALGSAGCQPAVFGSLPKTVARSASDRRLVLGENPRRSADQLYG